MAFARTPTGFELYFVGPLLLGLLRFIAFPMIPSSMAIIHAAVESHCLLGGRD
jgi:hypothetical protein